ncbi:MAG: hypothetical protein JRM74_04900 [Nitrososphaerota archaeon]|nr:hypothetical protein [Nitrososphaerota archaeon]
MKEGRNWLAVAAALSISLLFATGVVFAQNSTYGVNVVASQSNTVTLSNGGGNVNNTATTGVFVSLTGFTGASSVVITTQKLSAPSPTVSAPSLSGTTSTFDVSIQLPAGVTPSANTMAIISFTSNTVLSSFIILEYVNGAWATVNSTVTGNTITGRVNVSTLTGTEFAIGQPPVPFYSSTSFYAIVAIIVIIALGAAVVLTRGRKRAPTVATK